ncbi:DUF6069 family protein [Micromonospora sp. SL1-18]|uniref:DUF6069 family protein n=1 Tax=Micromonospora sp. SL1-18 TaxID=3399128 RepID=UPI003A4E3EAC
MLLIMCVLVAAATLVVWIAAVSVAGVDLVAGSGGTDQPVTPVAVGVTTLLAGLASRALLALLSGSSPGPGPSGSASPWSCCWCRCSGRSSGVGTAATETLVAMHLVAAAVLVPMLVRTAGR